MPSLNRIVAGQKLRDKWKQGETKFLFDKVYVKQIQSRSKGYDISIQILKGKIVFPSDKSSAKKLLQFLNEELFRGAITEVLYETNSKRQADK